MTDKGAVVVLHVDLAQGSLPDVPMQAQPPKSVRGWTLPHWDRIAGLKARQKTCSCVLHAPGVLARRSSPRAS